MSTRTRPWLAAVLAVLYPGLGHAYLRSWVRAVAWFGLAVLTMSVFILPEMSASPGSGFSAFYDEFTTLPVATLFPLFLVNALNVIDAYILARQQVTEDKRGMPNTDGEVGTCPNCGRELDEELDFCPWCTTRVETGETDEPTG